MGKQNLSREGIVTVQEWEKRRGVPDVSVMIPVYRGSQYIAQALRSVFAQRFTAYELIVVNDGSPETEQVERELLPYSSRLPTSKKRMAAPVRPGTRAYSRPKVSTLLFWTATMPGIPAIWRSSSLYSELIPNSI